MKKKNIGITYLILIMLITTIIGCGSHQYEKVTEETRTTTENPVGEETVTTTTTVESDD